MMFHYLATAVQSQGIRYVSSQKYHKNAECPSLAQCDMVVRVTDQQISDFEPCGQCYEVDQ